MSCSAVSQSVGSSDDPPAAAAVEEEKKEEWVVTVRFFRLMEQEGGRDSPAEAPAAVGQLKFGISARL